MKLNWIAIIYYHTSVFFTFNFDGKKFRGFFVVSCEFQTNKDNIPKYCKNIKKIVMKKTTLITLFLPTLYIYIYIYIYSKILLLLPSWFVSVILYNLSTGSHFVILILYLEFMLFIQELWLSEHNLDRTWHGHYGTLHFDFKPVFGIPI